ncbi:tyrosine-type recombinase/integrase [Lysinibacillus sp. NPDC096418]|uniref:tyrosine-type recombinase/integrase n=1 Tax=Lysinibacillus sp. NPDC096418 TaxID=3364138 RepID=UPI0037F82CFD
MSKKTKMNRSKKDKDLYWYIDTDGSKKYAYRHRYYDVLGKRKEKTGQGFTSETAAFRKLLEVKSTLLSGNSIQVEHENMTVGAWMDIWYESNEREWEITTQKQRINIIRHQVKPLIGKMKLSSLDKETYKRKFITPLLKRYKPSTVRLFHRVFKVAVNAAVDAEIIPRNRFTKVVINDEELEKPNVLNIQQLNKMLEIAESDEPLTSYAIIRTIAFTGIRRGEALALKWKNVDLSDGTITIEGTRDRNGHRTPKTKNSYRTIAIDDPLIKILKKYRLWCLEILLEDGEQLQKDDYVFISSQTREPYADNSLFYAFKRLSEKMGTTVKPHTLRHTHASILLYSGEDVATVAERLGNTPKVIWETYAHVIEDDKKKVTDVFAEALKNG